MRRWKPDYRKLLRVFCGVGIVLLLGYVLVNRWAQVVAEWRQTALASVIFMTAALALGWTLARAIVLPSASWSRRVMSHSPRPSR